MVEKNITNMIIIFQNHPDYVTAYIMIRDINVSLKDISEAEKVTTMEIT